MLATDIPGLAPVRNANERLYEAFLTLRSAADAPLVYHPDVLDSAETLAVTLAKRRLRGTLAA